MKRFGIGILFGLALAVASGAPTPSKAAETTLRVMTYNVLGLPCLGKKSTLVSIYLSVSGAERCRLVPGWRGKKVRERLAGIAREFSRMKRGNEAPDVILLQEVFTSKSDVFDKSGAEVLAKQSGYKHVAWGPPGKIKKGLGGLIGMAAGEVSGTAASGALSGGLLILSRYPIRAVNRVAFGSACADQDCGANKGALHVRLALPGGRTIDIFNTHMQHQRRKHKIRRKQIDILSGFIRKHAKSPWWIAGGDFNFRATRRFPGYQHIQQTTRARHAGQACVRSDYCELSEGTERRKARGRIPDHQFYAARGRGAEIEPVLVEVGDVFVDGKAASDHQYLLVDYSLR